ncbi:MAG TPA: DUF362 domain-containing protein [Nitrospirae bacterium]|nr:DUF362 domain-containing protein [Nitrospirota bacterium]HDK17315.1 DUF362 domain-containing protein [Nitrospirota bacterium]
MDFRFNMINADSAKEIKERVSNALEEYADIFPASKTATILLKPNLNANMNALTGNTTDLRLLAAVIEYFKGRGYENITIGEGTNSGYYRNNISVISRLKVDELAGHYGVKVIDLNYSDPVNIEFEDGISAGVAREVAEADFLINMPKLKTHFEAGMSACLKNMMGCLVGQENKKKTHQSLSANILNITKKIRPHLHIVDALISMEGLGPTRGIPINTGSIIIGTDPYLIDLMCAKLASFDYKKVRTLLEAEKRGVLSDAHKKFADEFELEKKYNFKPPTAGPLATYIHSPKRQKYFLAVRNTRFFTYMASTKWFGYLLFLSGLRQDNFIEDEMKFEGLNFNTSKCVSGCSRCRDYCPVELDLPEKYDEKKCIECLYCFLVCPSKAIEFRGELGFMNEQIRQYDDITRKVT